LVNVAKHSQAREVIVRVCSKADKIHIDVEDNGKGFDILKERPHNVASGGFGLFSIRERLGHMGGSFDIESKPDHGTCISLTAPLTA
jgi:signal transduction histidine kinase